MSLLCRSLLSIMPFGSTTTTKSLAQIVAEFLSEGLAAGNPGIV